MATVTALDVIHRQLLTITLRLDDLFQLHQDLLQRLINLDVDPWQGDTEDDDYMEEDGSGSDTDPISVDIDECDVLPVARRGPTRE